MKEVLIQVPEGNEIHAKFFTRFIQKEYGASFEYMTKHLILVKAESWRIDAIVNCALAHKLQYITSSSKLPLDKNTEA